MTPEAVRLDLHAILERFVLGERSAVLQTISSVDLRYAVQHALHLLESDREHLSNVLYELRLRVALHFSPVSAIEYDRRNPRPRYRLILEYLRVEFDRSGPIIEQLARDVARVLDEWDANRLRTTGHLEKLLMEQGGRCAHCGVVLWPIPNTSVQTDEYKPYHLSPEELLQPEVDHIEPISGFGTNRTENLQGLCRLCNQGKGDGLGIHFRSEVRYAATRIDQIPLQHRLRMFYHVLERNRSMSQKSTGATNEVELTMRPIRSSGGFIRSNLMAVAVDEV